MKKSHAVDDPPADRPQVKGEYDECTAPTDTNVLPVWGGDTPFYAYHGSLSLADSSGGSTSYGDFWGYLAYAVDPACTSTSSFCAIHFDALEGIAQDVSGFYTDAAGSTYGYSIDDLDISLVQAVEGIYYPARGTITFPNTPFGFIVSASAISAVGSSLGATASLAIASSASASLSSAGLTMYLNYSNGNGSGTLALQAN